MPTEPTPRHLSVAPLFALLLGGFITIFDLFVVNVALSSIRADLQADLSGIGWIVAGYELTFGVLLIAGARLGDRYGRRRVYILGTISFTLTSVLCGLAPDTEALIAARLLQGAAAGILFPQIYAMLRVLLDEERRPRAFGLLGMALGLAAIAGQVLGGWIVTADIAGLGWRMIFLSNLPVGLVGVLCAFRLPENSQSNAARIDRAGTLLATLALLLLLVPLLEGAHSGWPLWTWVSFLASAITVMVFVAWERRVTSNGGAAAVDPAMFANRSFAVGSGVVLLVYSTSTSFFLGFALLVQEGLGLSAFAAGALFAPASVAFVTASMMAPRVVARFGTTSIAGGAVIYLAGTVAVALTALANGSVAWMIPALIVFGFGQGLSMTPLLNFTLGFTTEDEAGMAGGILSTMQQVGGAIGVAVIAILFRQLLSNAGYANAFAGSLIYNILALMLAAIGIVWLTRRRSRAGIHT
ncbi:MFS transporter [Celeribacter sp.]|uniref:MFS transporter n=1 Tax=Celeribacter sp. TaxID=1890673 RepID=UPI003A957CEB